MRKRILLWALVAPLVLLLLVALSWKPVLQGTLPAPPAARTLMALIYRPADYDRPLLCEALAPEALEWRVEGVVVHRYRGAHRLGLILGGGCDLESTRAASSFPGRVACRFFDGDKEVFAARGAPVLGVYGVSTKPQPATLALLEYDAPSQAPLHRPVRVEVTVALDDPAYLQRFSPLHLVLAKHVEY